MKCGRFLSALLFVCFAFVSSAFSQDAVMVLDHKELGVHQRPLVRFNHEKHSTNMDCSRCHHDYDKHGNNKGEDGQPCTVCHGQASGGKARMPLERAFHAQCKGCHETMRTEGFANGPVLCGECHVRK